MKALFPTRQDATYRLLAIAFVLPCAFHIHAFAADGLHLYDLLLGVGYGLFCAGFLANRGARPPASAARTYATAAGAMLMLIGLVVRHAL